MSRIQAVLKLGFIASMIFVSSVSARPKDQDPGQKDVLADMARIRWTMGEERIKSIFPGEYFYGGAAVYTLEEIYGKKAVICFLFDRNLDRIAEVDAAVPVGDISLEEGQRYFDQLEMMMKKHYGAPRTSARGKEADRIMPGLAAYDLWQDKGTDIILLFDINSERLAQIKESLGPDLPEEAAFIKENSSRAVAIVMRGEAVKKRMERSGRKKK